MVDPELVARIDALPVATYRERLGVISIRVGIRSPARAPGYSVGDGTLPRASPCSTLASSSRQ